MKFYYKFMLLMLVLMGLGLPMIIQGPDGQPLMTISDWLPEKGFISRSSDQLKSMMEKVVNITEDGTSSGGQVSVNSTSSAQETGQIGGGSESSLVVLDTGSGKMYKWQDEKGGWHFSNEKPLIKSQVSIETLPEIKNLMSAPVVRPASSSKLSPSGISKSASAGFPGVGLSVSRDQASKMLKQLDKITKDAEQRKALMDQ